MTSAAQAATSVTGKWDVNTTVVKISLTGTNAYTEKLAIPTEHGSCTLPKGTVAATFSGTGPTFTGQYASEYTSGDCAFAGWSPVIVTLKKSGNKIIENINDGEYIFKLKRVL